MTIADVPVAILAGGLATRLGPEVAALPKALVPVAGRPFIDHQLAWLRGQGIARVVLCVGHLGSLIEAHVGAGAGHGLEVRFAYDGEHLRGTGGALRAAAHLLGPLAFVMYGDSYLDIDLPAVLTALDASPAEAVMTVLRNEGRWDRSNVLMRGTELLRYDKHRPEPAMAHVDYGLSLLRRQAIERIPSGQGYDLGDLYRDLVAAGRMIGFEATARFYEIGSPAGLADTRALFERTSPRSSGH